MNRYNSKRGVGGAFLPLDIQIVGQGVYTPREAARLIGGTSQRVLRWTHSSKSGDPLWNAHYAALEGSTEISFLDLIELRVVEALRRESISLQSIRYAIKVAQEKFDIERPLASQRFKVDGSEILMEAIEEDGQYVSLSKKRPGQKVFREIIRQSLSDLEYEDDFVARWRPKSFQEVIIDPSRRFGDPILDKYGVSTSTLFQDFQNFGDLKYISRIYEIPLRFVKEGLEFEKSLEAPASV